MGVHGHAHLDMVSIGLGHLFGPLSNMDHSLLSKTEMVQLVMPNWAMDGPFDSSRPFVTYFDLNLKRKKGSFGTIEA